MPAMTPQEILLDQLEVHEGFRSRLYDDATGKDLKSGDTIIGHPTIGIGWAVDLHEMRRDWARQMAREVLAEREHELRLRLPVFSKLDPVRQMALVELAYNMGVQGLLGFKKMLRALEYRDWEDARAELMDSTWATQVQRQRREALSAMIATGEWP